MCSAQHPDRLWGHVKKNVTHTKEEDRRKLKKRSYGNRHADGEDWVLSDSHIVGISTEQQVLGPFFVVDAIEYIENEQRKIY